MAKRKRSEKPGLLVTTAEAIGSTLGKLATRTGLAKSSHPPVKAKRATNTGAKAKAAAKSSAKPPVRTSSKKKRS